jgi:hypothetical protein
MKKILTFALLFVCASAVEAQEPTRDVPAPSAIEAAAPAAPAAAAPATAPAPEAPVVDLRVRSATSAAIDAATLRAPAPAAEAVVQDAPRNFWWLVGAIVLAGIILAVVL